jgi:hypothetical protein
MTLRVKILTTYDKKGKDVGGTIMGEYVAHEDQHSLNRGSIKRLTATDSNQQEVDINIEDTNIIIDDLRFMNVFLPADPVQSFWCSIAVSAGNHKLVSDKHPINGLYYEYYLEERRHYIVIWSDALKSWSVVVNL